MRNCRAPHCAPEKSHVIPPGPHSPTAQRQRNTNDPISKLETSSRELRAKLLGSGPCTPGGRRGACGLGRASSQPSAHKAPLVWRSPEGPHSMSDVAAAPVGGGRARTRTHARLEAAAGPAGPGRASRRRAERSSQRGRRAGGQATRRPEIWRGIATPEIWRAAAHGAARPDTTRGARNTSGTTQEVKTQKPNEKCPRKQQHSQLYSNMPKSHMGNMRAS